MRSTFAVLTGLSLLLSAASAAEPLDKKADPTRERGLEVRLIARKTTYTNVQDPKALPEPDKRLTQRDYPPAPEVDLALEIRNVSDQELHMMVGGRQQSLELALKGPGAFTPKNLGLLDTDDRAAGSPIRLAPGKSYTIPIKRLCNGQRVTDKGYREFVPVYWTAPGEYTLTASFQTQMGWKDDKEESVKLRPTTLRAEPVKLTVKAMQK